MADAIEKIEESMALIRKVRERAYALGYAEARFKKHIETLTEAERAILGTALAALNQLDAGENPAH